VNGTRLYYEDAGVGKPLVLIHGNTLDTRMWDDQFASFAQHYRVVRYDMRGYGQSAMPTADPYSPAQDLKCLLAHLGIPRAHILGLSRGGAVALDFALAYPEATDTLMLADTGLWKFDWGEFGEFASGVRSVALASGVETARQCWLGGAIFAAAMEQSEVAARLKEMVRDYSGWHWLNSEALALSDTSLMQQLKNLVAPVLVLVGERDLQDFQRIAEMLVSAVPGAHKTVLPAVGHLSNMEGPVRFNEAVLRFLAISRPSAPTCRTDH
jgi:pimeloyl-ACP methyl ester carboxylesterase